MPGTQMNIALNNIVLPWHHFLAILRINLSFLRMPLLF